jgi:acetyltransferase-like isoleucine patch superfamily enzyme
VPADLCVIYLADQTAPAVSASIDSVLRSAVTVQQALSLDVDARVALCTPDPDVRAVLSRLDGIVVLPRGDYRGVGQAWDAVWPSTDAELLYLCTAASCPDPLALGYLTASLLDAPEVDAAVPGTRAPWGAVVRRRLLERHGGLAQFWCAGSRSPSEVLALLLRRAEAEQPSSVVVVEQAVVHGVPVVQPPRSVVAGWDPGEVWVARPGSVRVGAHTYFTPSTRFFTLHPSQEISLGAFCSIADDVRFLNPHPRDGQLTDPAGGVHPALLHGLHRPGATSTYPIGKWPGVEFEDAPPDWSGQPQVIGSDVWIGHSATILGPVTVGDGAIVGAGAVVTRDVEPYAVVAGNPARTVRLRFADDVVQRLLQVRWWQWPEQRIFALSRELASGPEALFAALDSAGTRDRVPS